MLLEWRPLLDTGHIKQISKSLQIHSFESFKNLTVIKYWITNGIKRKSNRIKYGVGFWVRTPKKTDSARVSEPWDMMMHGTMPGRQGKVVSDIEEDSDEWLESLQLITWWRAGKDGSDRYPRHWTSLSAARAPSPTYCHRDLQNDMKTRSVLFCT